MSVGFGGISATLGLLLFYFLAPRGLIWRPFGYLLSLIPILTTYVTFTTCQIPRNLGRARAGPGYVLGSQL